MIKFVSSYNPLQIQPRTSGWPFLAMTRSSANTPDTPITTVARGKVIVFFYLSLANESMFVNGHEQCALLLYMQHEHNWSMMSRVHYYTVQ